MIPDPSELDVIDKKFLILDDCFLGPQNKAEAYYTRGRHNNCDTFYISQNYIRLPRQTIRGDTNFIILFPQDAKNLMHIYLLEILTKERKMWCVRQDDLNRMFEPVIESKGKSTEAITKELVPIREEMKTLTEPLADTTEKMKQQQTPRIDQESNVFEQYLLKYGVSTRVLDKYFAIQRVGDNRYEMGNKTVKIDENSDIIVDGVKYDGTTGLWALVMMNDPPESLYTPNDLHM